MEDIEVVERASRHFTPPLVDIEDLDLLSLTSRGCFNDGDSGTYIASTLLALVPRSRRTDVQLEQDYPFPDDNVARRKSKGARNHKGQQKVKFQGAASVADESTFPGAFNNPALHDILDMQVYLTSKEANQVLSDLPFVFRGRPDVEQIVADMRDEALENGLKRVAVIVCAPARLARVLQNACVKFSDRKLSFDFHMEYQD
jgi:hypothetical protein